MLFFPRSNYTSSIFPLLDSSTFLLFLFFLLFSLLVSFYAFLSNFLPFFVINPPFSTRQLSHSFFYFRLSVYKSSNLLFVQLTHRSFSIFSIRQLFLLFLISSISFFLRLSLLTITICYPFFVWIINPLFSHSSTFPLLPFPPYFYSFLILSFSPRITNLPISSFLPLDYKSAIFLRLVNFPLYLSPFLSFPTSARDKQMTNLPTCFPSFLPSNPPIFFLLVDQREIIDRSSFSRAEPTMKTKKGEDVRSEISEVRCSKINDSDQGVALLSNRGGRVNHAAITNQPTLETTRMEIPVATNTRVRGVFISRDVGIKISSVLIARALLRYYGHPSRGIFIVRLPSPPPSPPPFV